jgi:microtubule-associated protein tau
MLHTTGFAVLQIENQKLEYKAESKVGSLANVKHKPGGGDVKIFDDKLYLKQKSGGDSSVASSEEGHVSGTQVMSSHSMTVLTDCKVYNFIFAMFSAE